MATSKDHTPDPRRGPTGILKAAVMVALALTAKAAWADPCLQGAIIQGPAAKTAGRIEICAEIVRQVPELQAALDQLMKAHSASDNRIREIERLLLTANAAATQVDDKTTLLAHSLAERLAQSSAKSDAATMREIRALNDKLEEVVERLVVVGEDRQNAEAAQALGGTIGQAVAVLDLDRANKLINGIAGLQQQLGSVEDKVVGLTGTVQQGNFVAVLAEASKSKTRGDMGQVAALSALVKQGKTFDGFDFSGVGLSGVQAQGIEAPEANFSLSRMVGAQMEGATLEKAQLVAAWLDRADFRKAKLRFARAAFSTAQGTVLREADLSLSSWTGADLRGANLQSANLRGANFAHADLGGADLSNADLTNAFLGNANLDDVKLSGAIFSNTDVSYTSLSTNEMTPVQRAGLCATKMERTQEWTVVQQIPSDRFSGGYEYRRIFEERFYVGSGGHVLYPACALRRNDELNDWLRPVWASSGLELWNGALTLHMESPLLEFPGRQDELLERVQATYDSAMTRGSLVRLR